MKTIELKKLSLNELAFQEKILAIRSTLNSIRSTSKNLHKTSQEIFEMTQTMQSESKSAQNEIRYRALQIERIIQLTESCVTRIEYNVENNLKRKHISQ